MTNNIAAIHTLKSKLQLSDDDYRALLSNLTGKSSSKDLTPQQREAVRDHLQGLAEKAGVATPLRRRSFSRSKAAASPRERKVWALWHQLYRDPDAWQRFDDGLQREPARHVRRVIEEQDAAQAEAAFATAQAMVR